MLFLKLFNMSVAAGWLVLAVVLLRLVLRRAPKSIRCVLWAVVAVRLVCPVSFESVLSLVPSAETVPETFLYADVPAIHSGIQPFNAVVNPVIGESLAPAPAASANPAQIVVAAAEAVWLLGLAAMLLYALVSTVRLCRRMRTAVLLTDNIYQSEAVGSPFVLGVFRPRIYLPFRMDEETRAHVVAHERAHIRRRDHWVKPAAFLLLSVYWFHPLLWLAYILLCRDIELACDERVVRELGESDRKAYSKALLLCSVSHRAVVACPVAFGEGNVRERVKSVLHYKKPAFWIMIAALAACIALAVCFLTNPVTELPDPSPLYYKNALRTASASGAVQAIYCPPEGGSIQIGEAGGAPLALYADKADWRERRAPWSNLTSPGSVEFVLADDYRVTVYERPRVAVVRLGEEKRYYRTGGGDYAAALALLSSASDIEGAFGFERCVYQCPLSSYYPFNGTGCLYVFSDDRFEIQDLATGEVRESASNIDWTWVPAPAGDDWRNLFFIDLGILELDASASPEMLTLSEGFRLLRTDGELWLVQMSAEKIWSVYALSLPDADGTPVRSSSH